MSEGLSQDDFRKLLATPRPPLNPDDDSKAGAKFKIPAPRTPLTKCGYCNICSTTIDEEEKVKYDFKKTDNNDEDGEAGKKTAPQTLYRDRAAERRQQELATATTGPAEVDPAQASFSIKATPAPATSDYSQLSTEELLKRTQAEKDEELDAKQLYEQSKYLGGDVDHTHLVKGLDFALLQKVRKDLEHRKKGKGTDETELQDMDEDADEELDQVLDKFERGETITTGDEQEDGSMKKQQRFRTVMAKNIVEMVLQPFDEQQQLQRTDLFESGRMAYVFELADEVGNYSDPFAIPTAVIRSKADMQAKISSRGGWTEENQSEADLVIEKVSQVMAGLRRGERGPQQQQQHAHQQSINELRKNTQNNSEFQQGVHAKAVQLTSEPIAMGEDGFDGDIFAGVGRDYKLDESTTAAEATKTNNAEKGSYFQGLPNDEDEEMAEAGDAATDNAVNALLTRATSSNIRNLNLKSVRDAEGEDEATSAAKKMKYSHDSDDIPASTSTDTSMLNMDADEADIDMFGLGSSALPTSFEEHKRTVTAYQSDDDSDTETGDKVEKSATQMMDQGTNRNKKAQLTRWDFDTEEEWQKYKDSIEIHPKSAFQYGVKLGDGRKRNRERRGLSEKQKLDREFQQVNNIMSKKYGKSLDK